MKKTYFLVVLLLFVYSEFGLAQVATTSGPALRCSAKPPSKKQTLEPRHLHCGRMLLLEKETGLSAVQAVDLYSHAGAKNFGQFVVAILVSQRLNLDRDTVLNGLSSCSLGEVVQRLGIDPATSRVTILAAVRELVQSEVNR